MNEQDKQAYMDYLKAPKRWLSEIPSDQQTWQAALDYARGQQEPDRPFECWSSSEGDSWFDHPADAWAIQDCLGSEPKVGDEYELLAGWRSVTARYRIVSQDGDDFEVECVSHPTQTHPAQPVQPAGAQGEPVGYINKDDLEKLLSRKIGNYLTVGLDTRQAWPVGLGESKPYDHLVALYTHPAQPVQPASCQYCDGTGDVHGIDGEWRGECNECKPAAAINEQLIGELKHIAEYWNRDQNERAMADALWHIIRVAEAAIAAAEAAKGGV